MPKGTITHIEFPADDLERAQRFYGAVAGWEFGPMEGYPDYVLFQSGEEGHGGGIGTRGGSVASTLRIYITVDRLEDAIAAVEANGGHVTSPPQDVPGQGRFASVTDSEGTEIALWESAPEG